MPEEISSLIVDLDGVVWMGNKTIESAVDALQELQRRGVKLVFLTNNSTLSRRMCVERLRKMGLRVEKEEVFTSSYGAARYLSEETNPRVYVIGEKGLREELEEAGIELLPQKRAEDSTHVVVGLDRKLTYDKLAAAMRAILRGARFIATNRDCSFPTEGGLMPGAGALVAALEAATSRAPEVVIGKPNPFLIQLAMKSLNLDKRRTALVGDRIDCDIPAGKAAGIKTVLVLTGVTKRVEKGWRVKPDLVVKSLRELL